MQKKQVTRNTKAASTKWQIPFKTRSFILT